MNDVPTDVRRYLAEIGRRGGVRSRRKLTSEQAHDMVRLREAKKAFKLFHTECFWYLDPNMKITIRDLPEIVRGLRANGGQRGFLLANKLCH